MTDTCMSDLRGRRRAGASQRGGGGERGVRLGTAITKHSGQGHGVKRGEEVRKDPAAPLRTGYPARSSHLSSRASPVLWPSLRFPPLRRRGEEKKEVRRGKEKNEKRCCLSLKIPAWKTKVFAPPGALLATIAPQERQAVTHDNLVFHSEKHSVMCATCFF